MATKLSTDVIDLSGNTEALTIPKGTTNSTIEVEYLVVAGGGGGGGAFNNSAGGGGGGAGGLLTGTGSFSSNATITIGSGGTGNLAGAPSGTTNGQNSVFDTITTIGGGFGGSCNDSSTNPSNSFSRGQNGGSGGGGQYYNYGGSTPNIAGSGTAGQGFDGGIAYNNNYDDDGAGGGGGASAAGSDGTNTKGGDGGDGTAISITGSSVTYAGGGGGGQYLYNTASGTYGDGGSGGGGNGGRPNAVNGTYGMPSTGGGGGGASANSGSAPNGGNGGSGTVIIKYPTANTLTVGSGLYGNYATGTTGLCSWPTASNGVSLFQFENNITDTCGNSSASWSGTAAYSSTAKFGGYSAEFSGGTGGTYIDSGVDPTASSNWTVSMWMYRTNTSAFDFLFGSFDSGLSTGFGVAFYGSGTNNGKFDVYIGNSGSYTRTQGSGTNFNTWEHVAITHNSSGSGSTTIYHNGKSITASFGANPMVGTITHNLNWMIGSGGTYNVERFNGYIDQARFYDTELTAAEIELLYAETASATTGTIGSQTWSKFIGGTGTVSFANATGGRPISPTEGLMRENTTTGKMEFYDGSLWQEINDTVSYSPSLIPSANFNTVLYSGTSSTPTVITGVGFKPDFTWLKARTNSWSHGLFSSLMPVYATTGGYKNIYSNNTDTATDLWGSLQFDDDGWSGLAGSYNGTFAHDFGMSGYNYVSWNWKAGGAATTISGVGTINSDVSANTAAGFSIVKYTGDGSAGATIAHGLGDSPEIVFSKSLDSTYSWNVFNHSLPTNYMIKLNTDGAAFDGSAGTNGGAYTVSNTLLTIVSGASTQNNNNASGDDFIAYCWRSIPGYSKIGFYVGNGSTTGPIVYTGFKPAWLMVKRTDTTANWRMVDNKRNTTNPRNSVLYPNLNNTEYTDVIENVDFLTTGFQLGNTDTSWNALGGTFIYMAFSE